MRQEGRRSHAARACAHTHLQLRRPLALLPQLLPQLEKLLPERPQRVVPRGEVGRARLQLCLRTARLGARDVQRRLRLAKVLRRLLRHLKALCGLTDRRLRRLRHRAEEEKRAALRVSCAGIGVHGARAAVRARHHRHSHPNPKCAATAAAASPPPPPPCAHRTLPATTRAPRRSRRRQSAWRRRPGRRRAGRAPERSKPSVHKRPQAEGTAQG
eukprot:4263688-Prymnesium_polylepis.2